MLQVGSGGQTEGLLWTEQAFNGAGIFFSCDTHTLCVIQSVFWTFTANVQGLNELCEADLSLTFGSFSSLMCIPLWPDNALFSTA